MIQYIVYGFILYFFYRFITRYVLPIVRVVSTASKQVRNMQDQMKQSPQQQQQSPPQQRTSPKSHTGDYIEFEEVK